jgi:hypothetical protein
MNKCLGDRKGLILLLEKETEITEVNEIGEVHKKSKGKIEMICQTGHMMMSFESTPPPVKQLSER